eukprot:g23219.t1
MCEQMARRRLDRSTRPPLYMSLGPFGLLRCLQISFLLALLIFVFKELAPNGLAQMYPRLSVELLIEANDSATPTRDVHPYLFTTRTDLPTQGSLHQPENSPAPLIDVNPFKVQDEDPPSEEFAPVFIEEALMKRKDLRICELDKWNWTVADPDKAIFYFVCCGPIERFLELPRRTPERPYLCYDCDAKLQMGSLAQDDCLLRQKCSPKLVALLSRRDFMFSSSDLRGWNLKNDSALLLPGVTHVNHIPAPEKLMKNKVTPSDPPKYFLTFQGIRNVGLHGASYVRLNLEALLNTSMQPPKGARGASGEAIPVILADGWILPLDELIKWEQISLQLPEELSLDPEKLLDRLPRDAQSIAGRRQRLRDVYGKLMSSQEKRLVGLLRAAALWKRQWQVLEKQTLRMLADAATTS